MYRLFDHRYYYYKKEYLKTNSAKIMRNLIDHRNLALVAFRQQSQDGFQHAFVTDVLGDKNAVSLRTREINYYFPLYLFDEHALSVDGRSNVAPNFTHMPPVVQQDAEQLFAYIYAILHAPSYRSRYVDYLKTDFPRVPITSNNTLFSLLSGLGFDLIALHTLNLEYSRASWNMQPDRVDIFTDVDVHFTGGHSKVTKGYPKYHNESIFINPSACFHPIPEVIWKFYIGGYQVLNKWLKDRKGRTLSEEDIEYYKKVVKALHETSQIMQEIDEVIEAHGGWPLAGSVK